MTRIIYDDPITFETNGDCSSITLNFPPGTEEAVKELRKKLKDQGFVVQDHSVNDNMIRLLCPGSDSDMIKTSHKIAIFILGLFSINGPLLLIRSVTNHYQVEFNDTVLLVIFFTGLWSGYFLKNLLIYIDYKGFRRK